MMEIHQPSQDSCYPWVVGELNAQLHSDSTSSSSENCTELLRKDQHISLLFSK